MSVKCKNSIAILLATYNGETYIAEQLDSLFKQTEQDFEIFIHDDGSKDTTLEMIESFIKKYPERITLLEDVGDGRGAMGSFMWLLDRVEADYYMFCDQDDVWLPSKIQVSMDKMREIESRVPDKAVMIHTDLRIVDSDLNTMYESFWAYAGYHVDLMRKFEYAAVNNVFTGCTMLINRRARDLSLPYHPKAPMHDWWIGLVVAKRGVVDNVKQATVLYRQHGGNVESVGNKGDFKFKFMKLFGFMNKYNRNKEMLRSLGFGYWQAFRYKVAYTLHRSGILG